MRRQLIFAFLVLIVTSSQAFSEAWLEIPHEFQRDYEVLEIPENPDNANRIGVFMDAAWFSAEVDFYQPVLKQGFRAMTIQLDGIKDAQKYLDQIRRSERDLWEGKSVFENRESSRIKEPYTGLYVIYPYGRKITNTKYLTDVLPAEYVPFPEEEGWLAVPCIFSPDHLTDDPSNLYLCSFRELIDENVLATQKIQDENLWVVAETFEAIRREVSKWRVQ